jgi:hypothetical protein
MASNLRNEPRICQNGSLVGRMEPRGRDETKPTGFVGGPEVCETNSPGRPRGPETARTNPPSERRKTRTARTKPRPAWWKGWLQSEQSPHRHAATGRRDPAKQSPDDRAETIARIGGIPPTPGGNVGHARAVKVSVHRVGGIGSVRSLRAEGDVESYARSRLFSALTNNRPDPIRNGSRVNEPYPFRSVKPAASRSPKTSR